MTIIGIKNEYKIIDDDNIIIYLDGKQKDDRTELYVDRAGFEKLQTFHNKWSRYYNKLSHDWYGKATIYGNTDDKKGKGKSIYLHRFICDVTDPNQVVDHIDHNGLNNRMNNLRVTSVGNNDEHRRSKNSNNTSGYRNVIYYKHERTRPWKVVLQINGKSTVLGGFSDVDDAGVFAEQMRQKYYGKFKGAS